MRKAQGLLGCILLAISITLPNHTGATTLAERSRRASKAAGGVRKVSQITLKSVERLKEAFQRDIGKVRLVTILSPT